MHGTYKSCIALRGADHPQNRTGEETKLAKAKRIEKSALFLYLRDMGDTVKMFNRIKTRGRKLKYCIRMDLTQRNNMLTILWKIFKEKT